jgi:dihydropteroate synthase
VGGFIIHKVVQSKLFSSNKTLRLRGKIIDLSTPKIMGILNVTPDSFYQGSRHTLEADLLKQVEKMLAENADIIDVGGYSSRPGAQDISMEEEWSRVKLAFQSIKKEFPHAILSIDTFRSEIAQRAIHEGGDLINDISAGQLDINMFRTVAALKVPYVIMHMRGTPQNMKEHSQYDNLLMEVINYFHSILFQLNQYEINDIVIDPGFGFAKTTDQNFELLNRLDHFQIFGKPVLVGLSRKSMIWKTLDTTPDHALNGTTALNTLALLKGASILRVHDVSEAKQVISLLSKLH